MKLKAIAYLRVSTVEQKAGYGLEVQEEAVRTHAKSEGLKLVDVVRDEAISGKKGPDLRPGLAQTILRLEDGAADVLLVPKLDRLARDQFLQEMVIRQLRESGKDVVSVAEPDAGSDDGPRKLVRQILGAVAEYEAWLIAARLKAGRDLKRSRGEYAQGRPRYGFRAERGDLLPVEEEQAVIRLARKLSKQGMSLRQIAQSLDHEGHHPRTGGAWHPPMVARLLRTDRPPRQREPALAR
jgi:DNA invertase Pin-like site-specific DNA recombinase